MLFIKIKNFVLIKELALNIEGGLNGIIGNSGAGKSLIHQAIQWLSSIKKDSKVIGPFEQYCEVCIEFNQISLYKYEDTKKRILKLNDEIVTLVPFMEAICQSITTVAQSSSFTFFTNNQLLNHLDQLNSDNQSFIKEYQTLYETYALCKQSMHKALKANLDDSLKDYYHQVIDIIDECPFRTNQEEEEMIALDKHYQSIEKKKQLSDSFKHYKNECILMLNQLNDYQSLFSEDDFNELINDRSAISNILEFNEIKEEIDVIDIDQISQKLFKASSLKRKFKVNTIEQLMQVKQDALNKLQHSESALADYDNAKRKMNSLEPKLTRLAFQLHNNRLITLSSLENKLYPILYDLGLKQFHLNIYQDQKEFNEYGNWSITLSVNYNHLTYNIDQLSIGEKARFLLAFYCASNTQCSQLICFDEIDSGVSGENVRAMANYLYQLSLITPVLLISHNPIIAARCSTLYQVSKLEDNLQTITVLTALNDNDKIEAIAKLLSGINDSTSIQHAKQLLHSYE